MANPWYVVQRASGIPKDPGQEVYVAIEAASSAAAVAYGTSGYGGTVKAGPFATETDADNWIDGQTGLASGTTPSTTNQVSAAHGTITAPNLNWALDASGLKDWFFRGLMVVGGLFLMGLGISKMLNVENKITEVASKIPVVPV
jgi:hypothetical protein